jgi:putative endonuclease
LDLFKTKPNRLKESNKREFGENLEKLAAQQLVQQGLKIVAENYLCKMGEIDIIARDNQDLVFIEVRYRKSEAYGGSLASVDKKKQHRVILAASHYLQKHKLTNKIACRFDVIAITGSLNQLRYNWIKGAFS